MTRPRLPGALGALLPLLLARAAGTGRRRRPPKIDTGDTAWMLASTALVLMMTIPGLALFYAGMVRKKNILATLMQSFAITCIVTIVWTVAGYSLAFTNGNAYMGDLSRFLLHGIADHITKGADTGRSCSARASTTAATADDHPRDRLHDVPDDVRDHHAGADRRRVRRPHEVLGAVHLHDAVVAADLLADRALGVGADRLGFARRPCSTSPAAPSCTSTPASPAWCARSCWASGSATAATTWRRTTWPTR